MGRRLARTHALAGPGDSRLGRDVRARHGAIDSTAKGRPRQARGVLLDRGLARPQTSSAAMVHESVVIRIVPYGGRDSGLDTNLILGILPL